MGELGILPTEQEIKTENNKMLTRAFLKLTAQKAGFTITDVTLIYKTMRKIILENIQNNIETNLNGLMNIIVTTRKARRGLKPGERPVKGEDNSNKYEMKPECNRIAFRAANNIRNLVAGMDILDLDNLDNFEDEDDNFEEE